MGSRGMYESDSSKLKMIEPKDWTLAQTEEYLRGLDHEEAYAFDKDGKMIGGVEGGKTSVGIPKEWMQMEGITVTHSHPTGADGFGGTLSINRHKDGSVSGDLPLFAKTKWKEMRATASGQGEMNYIFRQNDNSRTQALVNVMKGRMNTLQKNMRNVHKTIYEQELAKGRSKAAALKAARQRSVGILDRQYKKTASKYGVDYITRKTPHKF